MLPTAKCIAALQSYDEAHHACRLHKQARLLSVDADIRPVIEFLHSLGLDERQVREASALLGASTVAPALPCGRALRWCVSATACPVRCSFWCSIRPCWAADFGEGRRTSSEPT